MKTLSIIFTAVAFMFTISCGKDHDEKPSHAENLERLRDIKKVYVFLNHQVKDGDGWIMTDKCDALLHNSLNVVGGGQSYDSLFEAEDVDGRWWRRPARDCLSRGKSKSTISRDMLLGLLHAIWKNRDLAAIESVINYGEDNDWKMGDHDGSLDGRNRVKVSLSLQATMYQMRKKLGGSGHGKETIGQVYTPVSGFHAHLQALTILIQGQIHGAINTIEHNSVKALVNQDPNNALFQFIKAKFENGDQSAAVEILLRDSIFPSHRLPTSSDRCSSYLFEHGFKDSDWMGCDEQKTHPGHDFLFVSSLILDYSLGR